MKKWMIENWDFILILVVIVLIAIIPMLNIIFTSKPNQPKKMDGMRQL